jgi:hypothetical protein
MTSMSEFMMKRPTIKKHGALVTTPKTATMLALLGGSLAAGSVWLSRDELRALRVLYGYTVEGSNPKPPSPEAPKREDFQSAYDYDRAVSAHKKTLAAHATWTDPRVLLQAGADRNLIRHAEADGLRLMAWIAKFIEPDEDPLKTIIQLAIDAGWDVDPSDVSWAQDIDEDEAPSDYAEGLSE